ncbi:MAG: type IV secretory system conjugative DNA transfer family protein [Candidatus Gracilibacteria bacterium]|nr:type IV secretory system conjugative DNA transfer family protein [Candidatus Gracilibacteria bacterium]MDD2908894.1 type IV secretory system conjugative DNA transfer family protein [Candidatus Gracilibacteria bacterium]
MLEFFIPITHAIAGINGLPITKPGADVPDASASSSFGTIIGDWLGTLGYVFAFVIICRLVLLLIRLLYEIKTAKRLVYFKVTLPRADSKLDKEKETKKDFKEKTGIMSMFFKAVHKINDLSFVDAILNAIFDHAKISLEIVYNDGQVHFYISTYKECAALVGQQITSNYPDAEVKIIDKKEYIDIKPEGYALKAMSSGKAVDNIFPIKTYKYFEDDPLSSMTNAFGSLKKDDKAVYQIVIKPMGKSWSNKAKKAANLVAKGQYKRGIQSNIFVETIKKIFAPFLNVLYFLLKRFIENSPTPEGSGAPGASSGDSYKIFNQAEQESQKAVGESAGQPGYQASIRFLVASKTVESAKQGLDNLMSTTSIYRDEYNNQLDEPRMVEDLFGFILTPIRYIAYKYKLVGLLQKKSIFSVDELSTLYHFPDINYNKSPVIKWLEYKMIAPPSNLKTPKIPTILTDYKRDSEGNIFTKDGSLLKVDENKNLLRDENKNLFLIDGTFVEIHKDGENKGKSVDEGKTPIQEDKQRYLGGFPLFKDGILMGWNEYRNTKSPIYFMRKDRGRHHYIIGKSGGGKSVLIGYLARQDLWNGDGLCIIDPHGDLVEDVIAFTPKERAKDVIVFDPSDYERPMGLNMLEVISTDPNARAIEKDRAALDATSIFIKIFNEEVFGPRIQHYFRNGCLTLMDDEDEGGTLIDVPRLFVDDAFMKYKTSKVRNPVVKAFWDNEYANTGDREKQEMIPYFSSKFGPFITNTTIRNIIGQPKSAFNLRRVMDDQKVLMVNLSKGLIGDLNAQLLGLIFVSKINIAAMSRADTPEDQRKDFYLYVDEFQNFATDTFGEILSEARKYHLALIMAHQFIAQIGGSKSKDGKPTIKDAVFGNAGTIMSFKVGAEDAEYLEKEYAPLLSQQDIIGIANFTTYCKLNIDNATTRPFDLKTFWDNNLKNTEVSKIIKEYSRKMYGRKKEYVDMEIEARLGIVRNEDGGIQ